MIFSREKAGFTLIELIVVILLISILAAFMLPRLNLDTFRETGFVQQSMAAIRYAQKQAIGSGCEVIVTIADTGCTLIWNGAPVPPPVVTCPAAAEPIPNPATGLNNFCDGSTPSTGDLPASISFDNIGRPTGTADDLEIILGTRTINIEPGTGFIYE